MNAPGDELNSLAIKIFTTTFIVILIVNWTQWGSQHAVDQAQGNDQLNRQMHRYTIFNTHLITSPSLTELITSPSLTER